MPVISIEKHDHILLENLKKMMLTGGTDRGELITELKGITTLKQFKQKLEVLCSKTHGQGMNWEPGSVFRGSRLRKRLEHILALLNTVYDKPLSLAEIEKQTVENKNNDWLQASSDYYKELCDEINKKDLRWMSNAASYGTLFTPSTAFTEQLSDHAELTLAKPLKCYLHYIDQMMKETSLTSEEIKNLTDVYVFVNKYMQTSDLSANREAIFEKILQGALEFKDESQMTDIFNTLRDLDSATYHKVFSRLINIEVKKRIDMIFKYLNWNQDEATFGAILVQLEELIESPPIPRELADLYFYQLGVVLSIEQYQYIVHKKEEEPKLASALNIICEQLSLGEIEPVIQDKKATPGRGSKKNTQPENKNEIQSIYTPRMDPQRFIQLFGPSNVAVKLVLSRITVDFNYVFLRDAYTKQLSSRGTLETYINDIKAFLANLFPISLRAPEAYPSFLSAERQEHKGELDGSKGPR